MKLLLTSLLLIGCGAAPPTVDTAAQEAAYTAELVACGNAAVVDGGADAFAAYTACADAVDKKYGRVQP